MSASKCFQLPKAHAHSRRGPDMESSGFNYISAGGTQEQSKVETKFKIIACTPIAS